MLASLRGWARKLGLLRGQRNRGIEGTLTKLRNYVAHPGGYNLGTPVDALSVLSDLAEIINQLWGQRTPGGHLYPAPVHRDVAAFAWRDGEFVSMFAENVQHAAELDEGYQYAIALAVVAGPRSDPHLPRFDSRFETTAYPVDVLWGPGTRTQAMEWLETNRPEADEFDHLDRLVSLRADGGQLSMPMRLEIAAGLPPEERDGRWYLVRADYPSDAFIHARNLEDGAPECAAAGPCRVCHAETVIIGTFAETIAALNLEPATPPELCGPFAGPRSMPAGAGERGRHAADARSAPAGAFGLRSASVSPRREGGGTARPPAPRPGTRPSNREGVRCLYRWVSHPVAVPVERGLPGGVCGLLQQQAGDRQSALGQIRHGLHGVDCRFFGHGASRPAPTRPRIEKSRPCFMAIRENSRALPTACSSSGRR